MTTLKIRTARTLRRLAQTDPRVGRVIRRLVNRSRTVTEANTVLSIGRRQVMVRSRTEPDARRVGVYLRGACDLPAIFGVGSMMKDGFTGTAAIFRDSIQISGSRSDFLLQSLQPWDRDATMAMDEAIERLRLDRSYFAPDLFAPEFHLPRVEESFPKTVVVLSTAPDFSRTMYRHKEHGFLVDPGGFWLNTDIGAVLEDTSTLDWFRSNYRSVGRLTVESFKTSFGELVEALRSRAGARVLAFNMLTVDPSDTTHSYRLVKQADAVRRRDFGLALAELSAQHDFDILDVDRLLKLGGVKSQVDFAHFSEAQFAPVAAEGFRILRDRQIL